MAWRFPKHRISNNSVIEIDDINENFRAVVEEGSGELNEHNWAAASWSNRLTDLADDVAVRVANYQSTVNPQDDATAPGSASLIIENETNWQPLGPPRVITTTGADFWLIASFAARLPWYRENFNAAVGSGILSEPEVAYGAMFAFRVDGKVLAESLVGSGDLSNDYMETQEYRANPQGVGVACFNSPAITATHAAVVVEAIATLPPGQHTIELVAMPPRRDLGLVESFSGYVVNEFTKAVTNREIILIELRR